MVKISNVTEISLSDVQEVECVRDVPMPATFFACFADKQGPALGSTGDEELLSYAELRAFIGGSGSFARLGICTTDVVAIVMPNGPELALAVLACMCQCIAAPLDPTFTQSEFEGAFMQLFSQQGRVLALREHKMYDDNLVEACKQTNTKLHYILKAGKKAALFDWVDRGEPVPPSLVGADETALVLRTSGTTSKPKVVPLTPRGLYTGAMTIGHGLGLTAEDRCLNVMPYTHIGGISCSLLSTLVTGGAVYNALKFDPGLFIKWIQELQPTWYYAVPTIHKAVALFVAGMPQPPRHRLRLLRSGAANMADKDARELRELFKCVVLPTYSMSECMPVAQPPLSYALEKPGTVGVPIASSMRVVDGEGAPQPFGEVGEVCIRGPVVTRGYLANVEANASSFFGDPDEGGCRWFRTGDVGYLDRDGYLFLTGRSKELIKRGGEQVSPYEVEEVMLKHPAVQIAVVFSVPNEFWGEEVAAAAVLKPGYFDALEPTPEQQRSGVAVQQVASSPASHQGRRQSQARRVSRSSCAGLEVLPDAAESRVHKISAGELANFLGQRMPDSKVPKQVVFLRSADTLPKTKTGKYIRTGLAEKLGIQAADLSAAAKLEMAAGLAANLDAAVNVPEAVKPDRSIYGIRYVFSLWVVFAHVGKVPMNIEDGVLQFSTSMPSFFILAGFLLSSATTRPIESLRSFYKSRIIAAHPMYMLAVLVSLPLVIGICPPGDPSVGEVRYPWPGGVRNETAMTSGWMGASGSYLCGPEMNRLEPWEYWTFMLEMIIMVTFAQLSWWPWGIKFSWNRGWINMVMWFSSSYYFCLLIFPFLFVLAKKMAVPRRYDVSEYVMRPLIIRYCCWPFLGTWGIVTLSTWMAWQIIGYTVRLMQWKGPEAADAIGLWPGIDVALPYVSPVIWACVFFLGVLLYNLFELNRRDPKAYRWPCWGILTDLLTLWILVIVPVAVWFIRGDKENPTEEESELIKTLTRMWSRQRPGPGFSIAFLLPWIYGMATGESVTSKIFGHWIFVSYLGPAAYSMYLFHMPVAFYYLVLVYGPECRAITHQGLMEHKKCTDHPKHFTINEFWLICLLSTLVAVFATHVLNAPLTSAFLKLFDCFCPCCLPTAELGHESTLVKVCDAIKGLTGADVDAKMALKECGLDSFGTSALLGVLMPKFPGLRISPMMLMDCETVGDLEAKVAALLAEQSGDRGDGGGAPASAAAPGRRTRDIELGMLQNRDGP